MIIGYSLSAIMSFSFGFYVLMRSRTRSLSYPFFLLSLCLAGYELAFISGISTVNSLQAQAIFPLFLLLIPISVLLFHVSLAAVGRLSDTAIVLLLAYAGGLALLIYFVLNLDLLLRLSTPTLYFPNYLRPAEHFHFLLIFAGCVLLLTLVFLCFAWSRSDERGRKRVQYLILGALWLAMFGSLPFFLSYKIELDPILSVLSGLAILPVGFVLVKAEVPGLRLSMRRSFFYALLVIIVGVGVSLVSVLNSRVTESVPDFPVWIIPMLSGVIVVAVGSFVWQKIQALDTLKNEFTTVITHKFRTPLTYIRWSLGDLERKGTSAEDRERAVSNIQAGIDKLTELTDILIGLSRIEGVSYSYKFEKRDIGRVVRDVYRAFLRRSDEKHQSLSLFIPDGLPAVYVDVGRLQFALQILLDNAITYTPERGAVTVRVNEEGSFVVIGIRDTGIGIRSEDLPYVFTKFFRSPGARAVSTEGIGIGLFMVKNIAERHGGDVWVESEGLDHGSTFFLKLPIARV